MQRIVEAVCDRQHISWAAMDNTGTPDMDASSVDAVIYSFYDVLPGTDWLSGEEICRQADGNCEAGS